MNWLSVIPTVFGAAIALGGGIALLRSSQVKGMLQMAHDVDQLREAKIDLLESQLRDVTSQLEAERTKCKLEAATAAKQIATLEQANATLGEMLKAFGGPKARVPRKKTP